MSEERTENLPGEIEARFGPSHISRQRIIQSRLFRIGGFLMVPVCVLGLFWQQSLTWLICPQALVVMFVRQWQHAYDSLSTPGYPDLAVAVLYYPLIGWILSRAAMRDKLPRVATRIVVWHVVAMGLALVIARIRDQLWGF